jgi:hypothetical protein
MLKFILVAVNKLRLPEISLKFDLQSYKDKTTLFLKRYFLKF